MSLKDLKSNLGDYRKPKSEPLEVKARIEPSAFNTVPLTDKIKTKNDVQYSRQTPEKVGTSQNKVTQGDKFKGETEANEVTQGDKFKGQTDPTLVNQTEKFKGETNPTLANQTEKFKGETNPTLANQTEKFKGETEAKEFKFTQKFLGETTPKEFKFAQNFLGETTPNESDRSSKFLGETTPNESDRSSKFLGETTPNESDRSSKFLGETTPNESDRSSKFLGETTPNEMLKQTGESFLGETTPPVAGQGDKFKGETTPNDFTFNGNLEGQGLEVPQQVNFFTDDKAVGFSPFMRTKDDTKFTGINGTQFDNASSLLSNFSQQSPGISFQAGYGQYKVGKAIGDTQRYSPDGDRNIDSYTSIGDLLQQRQSPSFLDEMYSKFNLQDPEANKFSLIPQPYVLRGIQRKKKGEPQSWGFGFPIDDGLIRGGAVASTERAAIDLVRMGSFFLSVKGLLWSATQIGNQRSNTYNKIWTPANFLAAIGGQQIGFKPDRSGILGLDTLGKYTKIGGVIEGNLQKPKNNLISLYDSFGTIEIGSDLKTFSGGTDSLYGIGQTFVKRYTNSFIKGLGAIATGNKITGLSDYTQKFFFKEKNEETEETYFKSIPTDPEDLKKYGVVEQLGKIQKFNEDNKPNLVKSDGLVGPDIVDIGDYMMISHGQLMDMADDRAQLGATPVKPSDFRKELDGGSRGNAESKDYDKESIETKFSFPSPGKPVYVDGKARTGQTDMTYDDSKLTNWSSHYDKIQASKIGDTIQSDLVNLVFRLGTDKSNLQFRGTVTGLAENFSPSYTEIKYSGRAEPVYVYESFKRDISFNFKVYPTSRVEMQPLWTKLERLATYTMPNYTGAGYTAPGSSTNKELKLTVGKLYVETPMILTSLSYTYSDEVAWDVDFGLPMGIDVAVGATVLGNNIHEYDSGEVFVFSSDFRIQGAS